MGLKTAAMNFSNWIQSKMLTSNRISASKSLTTDQVSFILGISDFKNMDEYEQRWAFAKEIRIDSPKI